MFGLVGKRKTLKKTDKEQLGRFSFARTSLMRPKPCRNLHLVPKPFRNPHPVPKPGRNPHLACRGGAGPTASCSHQQMSGQWGEGCFFSSRSDGGASSKGLLELSPACAHQTPWTVLAGPGSYLGMAKGSEAVKAEPPPPHVPTPEAPGEGCATGDNLMQAQPSLARRFNTVQPLQRKQEFSFATNHH